MSNRPSERLTRRAFSRRAAAAAAGLLVGGGVTGVASAEDATAAAPAEPPGFDAAMALAVLSAPYLPAADRAELESQVRSTLASLKTFRAIPLPDGTEPDFVFRATEAPR